jgi:ADP-ribosylation factor GTPase-activating protein 1
MQANTQQVFEELFKENENNICFECHATSSQWASVNNGIFLCLNCSGLHRGFGVNVSFVRSINMDSWSDLQLALMRNGGNARLREFFENYNIPKDGPIDFKYRTKAGQYYREMLKALAEGNPTPEPPSKEEGLELIATKNTNITPGSITGFGSSSNQANAEKGALENVKQGVVNFGSTVATGTVNFASKVSQKIQDPNLKDDVKGLGVKVVTGTKETAEKVAEKSKEIWNHRDEYLQKTTDTAKQGWTAAVGFFKKMTGPKTENAAAPSNNNEGAPVENTGSENTQIVGTL